MYPSDKYCQFKWSSIYKELKTEVNDFLNLFKSSFPGSSVGIHPCPIRSHRRPGFDPWVRKIPEGRKWHPLHCSCLENPMDGDAWWPTAHGVSQSWTGLKWLRMHTQEHLEKAMATHSSSCLESSMDREAWRATVCGVAESGTTEWLTHSHNFRKLAEGWRQHTEERQWTQGVERQCPSLRGASQEKEHAEQAGLFKSVEDGFVSCTIWTWKRIDSMQPNNLELLSMPILASFLLWYILWSSL